MGPQWQRRWDGGGGAGLMGAEPLHAMMMLWWEAILGWEWTAMFVLHGLSCVPFHAAFMLHPCCRPGYIYAISMQTCAPVYAAVHAAAGH